MNLSNVSSHHNVIDNHYVTLNYYVTLNHWPNENNSVRFKYFNFQALSEKNDFIRIHQLYEQLKFSVLSDEFNITEDQALTLASLQFFVDECTRKQIFGRPRMYSDFYNGIFFRYKQFPV